MKKQRQLNLITYMGLLAMDIQHLSDFVDNPQVAAEKAGLTAIDREVLFSGDQNRIYMTLVRESNGREVSFAPKTVPTGQEPESHE